MWPLTISAIVNACQNIVSAPAPSLAKENIIGAVTDSRAVVPHCLFVAIRGERFDGHDFVKDSLERGVSLALVAKDWAGRQSLSPNAQQRCLVVDDTVQAYRQIAATLRQSFSFPIFAIGGSNGKTTTKEILAALLSGDSRYVAKTQKSENGFIGIAQTINAAAKTVPRVPDALVLEIGIDTTGAMAQHVALAKPSVAMLTALEPEHVEGFGSSETAADEEFLLFTQSPDAIHIWQTQEDKLLVSKRFSHVKPQDVIVVEDARLPLVQKALSEAKLPLTVTAGTRVLVWQAREDTERRAIRLNYRWGQGLAAMTGIDPDNEFALWLPLLGHHNAANFALALGAALSHGIGFADLLAGLGNFQAPPQRSNIMDLPRNIVLIDDSYNASPASMRSGLSLLARPEWQDRPKFLFLGDMAELGAESRDWHLSLAPAILAIPGPVRLFLYGNEMAALHQALGPSLVTRGMTAAYLPKSADPSRFLASLASLPQDSVILIKGSRSMQLERLLAPLGALARA